MFYLPFLPPVYLESLLTLSLLIQSVKATY
nr:MAG TPA: hypothetical protein [Caudoviricetes sp.]